MVLRERLGIVTVKDGCAPQGQCGCCTVLVDGSPRVACVTPAARVEGRTVTTIAGLDPEVRERFAAAFTATGGSQCGFCTPGIVMRFAGERPPDTGRGLAAHLCRCTGWQTVVEALDAARAPRPGTGSGDGRDLDAAAERARLEGGAPQRVGADVPLGGGPFADDGAPRDALVAVPRPPGPEPSGGESVEAAGLWWVVADSVSEARSAAGKVQGRRTTVEARPPLVDSLPAVRAGGVALATQWVEPAYLEPDASWCAPGGEPASPLAQGGAFGGKERSPVAAAARELADRFGRPVRTLFAREDVVRLGPKRPPIAATAHVEGDTVVIEGVAAPGFPTDVVWPVADDVAVRASWRTVTVPGPPTDAAVRAVGLAEQAMLVAGALGRLPEVVVPSGARAAVALRTDGDRITGVTVEVAAGDPLDVVVLRSYAIGAVHMALGWIATEGLAVDPETGEVHDLTIRSFGIPRAVAMPPVDVVVRDDPAPPRARASDAVFAATAAAAWLAAGCPVALPVRTLLSR